MSFTSVTPEEVAPSEPVRANMLGKVRTNFDDHEARLQSLEGGSATTYPPIIMRVNGPYGLYAAMDNVMNTTTNFNITITGVRILIDKAGATGATEINLKYKRGSADWVSVLATKPSVNASAGDFALSTNGVVDLTKNSLLAGDILRLDLTSIQAGGRGFLVRIDFNRT